MKRALLTILMICFARFCVKMAIMKFNGTMIQYFEWLLPPGMLYEKLHNEAGKLRADGFTAVWLPPAYKGQSGILDSGYAPYDLYDLGEFDQKGTVSTKYGTKGQLIAAIEEIHKHGMQAYADIVLDHKMGADETERITAIRVNPENRNEEMGEYHEIEAWTKFTFPGRNGKYSHFTWNASHFIGTDWDNLRMEPGIFKFQGKNWQRQVDREFGNFDYLMGANIDLDSKEVNRELLRWGEWFLDTTGVDGFRMDAVKHMKFTFYDEWLSAMRKKTSKELFAVGEYWHGDYRALRNYVDTTKGALALFDVALHFRFVDAAHYGKNFDMRGIFSQTLTQDNPLMAVTFVDNHDTQPGQSLESFVPGWFKPLAYALVLLRQEGYPCVFYGDYYGIKASNIPPMGNILTALLFARQYCAYGAQHDYFDDPNIIGFVRTGDKDFENSGLVALLSNGKPGKKKMHVGPRLAGRTLIDITGNIKTKITIDREGVAEFYVNENSVSVYVNTEIASGK